MIAAAAELIPKAEQIVKSWVMLKLCRNGKQKERVVVLTDCTVYIIGMEMSSSGHLVVNAHGKLEAKGTDSHSEDRLSAQLGEKGYRWRIPLRNITLVCYGPVFGKGESEGRNRVASVEDHLREESGLSKQFALRIHYAPAGSKALQAAVKEGVTGEAMLHGFEWLPPKPDNRLVAQMRQETQKNCITLLGPMFTSGDPNSPVREASRQRIETGWFFSEMMCTEISHAIYYALCSRNRRILAPVLERIEKPRSAVWGMFSAMYNTAGGGIVSLHDHLI